VKEERTKHSVLIEFEIGSIERVCEIQRVEFDKQGNFKDEVLVVGWRFW